MRFLSEDMLSSQAKQIKNFNQAVNVPKEEFPMFGAQTGKWAMNSYLEVSIPWYGAILLIEMHLHAFSVHKQTSKPTGEQR